MPHPDANQPSPRPDAFARATLEVYGRRPTLFRGASAARLNRKARREIMARVERIPLRPGIDFHEFTRRILRDIARSLAIPDDGRFFNPRLGYVYPREDAPAAPKVPNVPKIYGPEGRFVDHDGRRFDYVFTELLKDPTLPRQMFPHPHLLGACFVQRYAERDNERVVIGRRRREPFLRGWFNTIRPFYPSLCFFAAAEAWA